VKKRKSHSWLLLTTLARRSPAALAGAMTGAMVASCILFMAGRGALETHQHAVYWIIKLAAIFLALLASMTLTTVWEEWVIWRLSSRPEGTGFLASVLRANLSTLEESDHEDSSPAIRSPTGIRTPRLQYVRQAFGNYHLRGVLGAPSHGSPR